MASPFFFVAKKDSDAVRPCQDYQYLNKGMIKNTYPLPLVRELLDKLGGANWFTKWIFNGAIITSESKKETNGNLPSKPIVDYSNPLSCSLDYVTPQQPSKR